MDDEELIARYYAGDDGAFTHLENRYHLRLCRFILHLLRRARDEVTAEDLTQQVWLRVARTRQRPGGRFDREGRSFQSWLFSIARNLAIDHLRRRGQGPPPASADEIDPAPGPEVEAIRDDEAALVRECLAGLPPEDREAIRLRFWDGLTLREIAERRGVTTNVVAARCYRVLARLREELGRRGFDL
jgi:RNA polymerase sigma-70 factor (ECF subfamily)